MRELLNDLMRRAGWRLFNATMRVAVRFLLARVAETLDGPGAVEWQKVIADMSREQRTALRGFVVQARDLLGSRATPTENAALAVFEEATAPAPTSMN